MISPRVILADLDEEVAQLDGLSKARQLRRSNPGTADKLRLRWVRLYERRGRPFRRGCWSGRGSAAAQKQRSCISDDFGFITRLLLFQSGQGVEMDVGWRDTWSHNCF